MVMLGIEVVLVEIAIFGDTRRLILMYCIVLAFADWIGWSIYLPNREYNVLQTTIIDVE